VSGSCNARHRGTGEEDCRESLFCSLYVRGGREIILFGVELEESDKNVLLEGANARER
jgi:hypothetical protein